MRAQCKDSPSVAFRIMPHAPDLRIELEQRLAALEVAKTKFTQRHPEVLEVNARTRESFPCHRAHPGEKSAAFSPHYDMRVQRGPSDIFGGAKGRTCNIHVAHMLGQQ